MTLYSQSLRLGAKAKMDREIRSSRGGGGGGGGGGAAAAAAAAAGCCCLYLPRQPGTAADSTPFIQTSRWLK